MVADTRNALEAEAFFGGLVLDVYTRVAPCGANIYIDLGDSSWRAIEVTPSGWSIVDLPPVPFRRAKGVLPLPIPVLGGSLSELLSFVNVKSDRDFILMCGWMLAALMPRGPYPVLQFHGEHGAAKSTSAEMLRALIDPNEAGLRGEPRDPRDFAISAKNSHLIAFDNLSTLSVWLSDFLCRLSTGGGFATRLLFTDDEEAIFTFQRPALLSGVAQVVTKSDLIDRTVRIRLDYISDDRRLTEAEVRAAFEIARPRILGALLSTLSSVLQELPRLTRPPRLPRMADFAILGTAAESAFGIAKGAFLEAYNANLAEGHSLAIEASSIGGVVLDYCKTLGPTGWVGTPTALFDQLNARVDLRKPFNWPKTSQHLSAELGRLAPDLRAKGFDLKFPPGHNPRLIQIVVVHAGGVASLPSPQPNVSTQETTGVAGDDGDAVPQPFSPSYSTPWVPADPLPDANTANPTMAAPIPIDQTNPLAQVVPTAPPIGFFANIPQVQVPIPNQTQVSQVPALDDDDDDQPWNQGRQP